MTSAMNAMPFGMARRIFTSNIKAVVARVTRQQKAEPKTERWEDRLFKTTTIANAIMGGIFGFFVSASAGAAGYTILTLPIGPVVQVVTTAGCFAGGALACIVPGRPRERGLFAFINRALQNIGLIAFSGVSTIAIFLALTGGDQRSVEEVEAANTERNAISQAKRDAFADAREVHGLVVADIGAIKADIATQKLTVADLERQYEAWDRAVRNEFEPGTGGDNRREAPDFAPRVGKKQEIAQAKADLAALRASMEKRENDAKKTLLAITVAGASLTDTGQQATRATVVQGFFAPAWAITGKALNLPSDTIALFAAFIASYVIVFSPIFKAIERGREQTRVHREAERTTRDALRVARKAAKKASRRSIGQRIAGLFSRTPEPAPPQPEPERRSPELVWPEDAGPAPIIRSAGEQVATAQPTTRAKPTNPGCPETEAVVSAIRSGALMHIGVTAITKFASVGSEKAKRIQAALVQRRIAEYTENGCALIPGAMA